MGIRRAASGARYAGPLPRCPRPLGAGPWDDFVSAPRLGRVAPVPFPGRPGRPRRAETSSTPAPRPARTVTTDPPGTPAAAPSRRLLTLADAARYLGVSVWTARAFEA